MSQYSREQYRNLSEEEKSKKHKYGLERYISLPKDEKQRLVEYRKNYSKIKKHKD